MMRSSKNRTLENPFEIGGSSSKECGEYNLNFKHTTSNEHVVGLGTRPTGSDAQAHGLAATINGWNLAIMMYGAYVLIARRRVLLAVKGSDECMIGTPAY